MQDLSKISRLKPIPAALLAIGLTVSALPAIAATLTPPGAFTGVDSPSTGVGFSFSNGSIAFQCTMTFNGGVPLGSAGAFSITHASFTNGGGTNGSLCGLVGAANFPWMGNVINLTTATISGVSLSLIGFASCSGSITVGYSNGSASTPAFLTFTGHPLGTCSVINGVLQVTNNTTSSGLIYTP